MPINQAEDPLIAHANDDPETRRSLAALQASALGIFEFEPQTNKAYWNDRVRDLWGIPRGEEITYETVIAQVHPDDQALHDACTEKALDPTGSGIMDMEYRVLPRDGSKMRWVHAKAVCRFEGDTPIRLLGTVEDVSERKFYEERNQLLIYELQHRVKNTLASIISVVKLSQRGNDTIEAYAESLQDRLLSMAETHSILSSSDWKTISIKSILEREFDAFVKNKKDALRFKGPDLPIPAPKVQIVSMAIHELLTNATKYGALSAPEGYIDFETDFTDGTARFVWAEKGTPEIKKAFQPSGGFGSLLLGPILSAELTAEIVHKIETTGAVYSATFPLVMESHDGR